MDDIVVTARRGGGVNLEYLLIPDISITMMYMASEPNKTVAEALSPTEKRDFRIAATDHTPQIIVKNATQSQLAAIVNAVTHADRYPGLNDTMREMASKGMTLTWNITDTPPSNFTFNQIGGIHFQITAATADSGVRDELAGSNFDITVVGTRIREGNLESSFNFVISHELGHLTRNGDGDFRTDGGGTGDTVYDIDNTLYDTLFKGYSEKGFLQSRDVAMTNHVHDMFGDSWQAFGNDGNNYVDSYEGTHDEIHVGAGNDIVVSRSGSDSIYVASQGVKIIIDYGSDGQVFDLDGITIEGVKVENFIGTRVGNDAYITYAASGTSPVNDDNATIIAGYYSNPNGSTIEYLFGDNGYVLAYELLGYPDGVQPYGWRSSSEQSTHQDENSSYVPSLAEHESFFMSNNESVIKNGVSVDILNEARTHAAALAADYTENPYLAYTGLLADYPMVDYGMLIA
jgi:hypothetical protein